MQINHNITAMNTLRQLNINSNAQAKSMSKLSSGLRINSAADDAAGLSISEKMKGQIRGLDQASRNAQDGISMISTAEGALGETQDILQRMRELATQAANGTNTDQDRDAIQKETNALTSEINRIGNTTEFNTQSLLKGDGKSNLTGTGLDISSVGSKTNGTDASSQEVKMTFNLTTFVADSDSLTFNINGKDLTLNFAGTDTGTAGDTTISSNAATIDLGNTSGTGNSTLQSGDDSVVTKAASDALQKLIDSDDSLKGNFKVSENGGVVTVEALKSGDYSGSKGNMTMTDSGSGVTAQANTGANGALTAYTADGSTIVNGTNTDATAASESVDLSSLDFSDKSKLTGKGMTINGTEIQFYDADKGAYKGNAVGIDISDVNSESTLVDAITTQAGDKIDGATLSKEAVTNNLVVTSTNTGKDSSVNVSDGGVNKDFQATFQIGANSGQTMTIDIKDMRSQALNISSSNGSGTVTASNGQVASFVASANVTDGTNNDNTEYSLDLSTTDKATAAISVLDDAINAVSTQRSALGAYTNRLDHTINNLNTSSQNITDASSRITDVDMASEMMNQTKSSVLAQAAQAMLAQANQQPQQVLQLLR